MDIRQKRERRLKLVTDARALLSRADQTGVLSAEDQTQYDTLLAEARQLKTAIDREEALEGEERELARSQREPTRPDPQADTNEQRGQAGAETRAAFGRYLQGGMGALSGAEMRALQADSDTLGGYVVAPEQFSTQLIQKVDSQLFLRQWINVLPPMPKAESLGIPSIETDIADASWTSELAIGTEDSSMRFGKRELSPKPLAKYIKVSNKLLRAAAIDVEALVLNRLAYKAALAKENAYINGTGTGQPLGVMVASNDGISTARDISTGNTITAFTADGLINAKYGLKAQYRSRAKWLFHTDSLKALAKLKDGDGQYIWQPGLTMGQPDRLLALPLGESELMPHTFTTGLYVGVLGDWPFYWAVEALSVTIQRLVELYALTNQTAFVMRTEEDAMPVLEEAFVRVTLA